MFNVFLGVSKVNNVNDKVNSKEKKIRDKIKGKNEDKEFYETLKRLEVAQKFSKKLYLEFKDFIKAIVFFGSSSREDFDENSDIDVLVIVDDVSLDLNKEAVEVYRLTVNRLILDTD